MNIIREPKSLYYSRVVLISKPYGSVKFCVDYRVLSSMATKDRCPIPRIDEILDFLSKAKIFSTLDTTSGYYQISMNSYDIEKTAFAYKNGFFKFVEMPFGLYNAPATF